MNVRRVLAKVVIVGMVAGGAVAVTATPALAMRNDDQCLLAYGWANYWQDQMESARNNEDYWRYFRLWAAEMNMMSLYC